METIDVNEHNAVPTIDGEVGATVLGPDNVPVGLQNPGSLPTDSGSMPNLKWSFAASHNRLLNGGWARETTVRELPVATTLAGVNMRLKAGAYREMHWHPDHDEWQYWLSGHARMTVFGSSGKARTFDYLAGDVGYVPSAMGHYFENVGDGPVQMLELFRSDHFADVSANQWLGLTPAAVVGATLSLDRATLDVLRRDKPLIMPAP